MTLKKNCKHIGDFMREGVRTGEQSVYLALGRQILRSDSPSRWSEINQQPPGGARNDAEMCMLFDLRVAEETRRSEKSLRRQIEKVAPHSRNSAVVGGPGVLRSRGFAEEAEALQAPQGIQRHSQIGQALKRDGSILPSKVRLLWATGHS